MNKGILLPGRGWLVAAMVLLLVCLIPATSWGAVEDPIFRQGRLEVRALLRAGGLVGYVIIALSIALVALIVEHVMTVRRKTMIPPGLADEVQKLINAGQIPQALELAHKDPSFLGYLLSAGLHEAPYGHAAAEKAMEDAAIEQSSRLSRKVEYFSLIGVLGPLLGLMGTVWGMIQAFSEFAEKANPQTADFAPGISEALVTTMFGIFLSVPAQTAFALCRNRIDEYVAETALVAASTIALLKKPGASGRGGPPGGGGRPGGGDPPRQPIPPVALERRP